MPSYGSLHQSSNQHTDFLTLEKLKEQIVCEVKEELALFKTDLLQGETIFNVIGKKTFCK